ncbi:MAG: hypothetical protein K8T10_18930 [Candidatus Eremiobacteraeota bacterium]|nr:hypothetical protein [Candidatus Eremiobacteraeota bacterium]
MDNIKKNIRQSSVFSSRNRQDHSIETGVLSARNIIENANYDLEKVGGEQDYFEKYSLQTQGARTQQDLETGEIVNGANMTNV